MSRESTAALEIATVSIPTRPGPPESLTDSQAEIWKKVVLTKPPEWFQDDVQPILIAYCQAIDFHQRVEAELRVSAQKSCFAAKQVFEMFEKSSKLIAALATKMRLTPQSRYTPLSARTADKKAKGGSKPWQN